MAHLLLFVLVFAAQLIAGFSTQKLPTSHSGSMITILSIDGGGIKGIIPATVLNYLDKALKAKDPNADLAHYFDVIGGTSTGGLITAMLAAPSPDDPSRAAFTPAQIVDFYVEDGPHIFNTSNPGDGPIFDGQYLHNITRELLKDTRLNQTLTKVVIPTFDLKRQKPVIFSSYKLESAPYLNALLSDICISTSAAPVYLPPYYFVNDGVEFNMIDGGAAAGNPTQATVSEVLQHNKYPKILVLSLGTGTTKIEEIYDVQMAATWNLLDWITKGIGLLGGGSTAMTELYLASLFLGFQPGNTYLRIEEYNLDPAFTDMANVTKENLKGLSDTGINLLKEKVVRMNLDTFNFEDAGEGTNAEALDRLAEILYEERQDRLKRKSTERGGRPFLETLRVPSDKTLANWAFLNNIFI
ncbi:unnamed protein product [Sphenostylis stenocarpa]|uniref:Patatin n=1 Tax=Sphenostylis stenocarpa TaxID=92480 RepID=A0AA86VM34_9FABA|nr:unnamed protein product [Sphenostylis stenocarpa]